VKSGILRRIVAFPLTLLVIEAGLFVGLAILVSQAARGLFERQTPGQTLGALLIALVLIAAWKGCKRWIERQPDRELELAAAPRELGLGLLAGFALFSAMTAIVALLGGFRIEGVRGTGQLWALLAMAIGSGLFEEILFRGILFRHIETMLGSWLALALTAALFGAAHLGNDNASLFSSLAIALEAGILLGAAFMLTRRLWLAIGIHAAWNFTQGWVFSIPVSGSEVPLGLLITRRDGPDGLTGGDFGLEASVVAMVVATLAGVLMLRRAVATGQVVAPMWRR
jgi:uncharacterized protein